MRLWIKMLIGALALMLVLVAGAALFISQADPNEYRGMIADMVEDATGRQLQIGGDLHIKLLPLPSVQVNDVTFANAGWASQPYMARVKHLRADVELWPLLEGRMVVHRFVAIEPEIFLEIDAEGRGNWEFGDEVGQAAETGGDSGTSREELAVIVNEVRIEKALLDYVDGPTGTEAKLDVKKLVLGTDRPGGRLALSLDATYQDVPVKLDGKLGAGGAILRNQPVEVDLKGNVGEAGLTVQGAVGKPHNLKDLRLDIALKSKTTKRLTDLAGAEIDELGPVDLKIRLVEQGGHLHFDPFNVSARPLDTDATISGSLKSLEFDLVSGPGIAKAQSTPMMVDLQGKFGDASFRLNGEVGNPLAGKDLRLGVAFETDASKPLTELAGIDFEEVGPVNLNLTLLEQDGRFSFDDIALTARPRGFDARMTGSVRDVVLVAEGDNAQEKPATVDVEGSLGKATYKVTGDVGKPMQGKDLRLNVDFKTKTTQPFTQLVGVDIEEVGPLNVTLEVIEKDGQLDLDAIDLKARPRDADVAIKGSVRDVVENPQPDLDISVSAKSLRQLDATLPAAGPVSVSAKVRPRGKVVEIRDLVARVGKSDLSGSATVDTGGERPSASAKLHASVIDLEEIMPREKQPGDAPAAEKKPGGKIFPDAPLPLDALKKANGNIELAVDRLITPNLTLNKVNVAAKLDDGNLIVKPAAHIAGGTVGGKVDIDSSTKPAKFAADINARKVSLSSLTKAFRGYEVSRGLDTNLNMKLRARGDSVRSLMGGLDGDVQIEIGEGRLNNDTLDRLGGDLLTQIAGFAVPTDETEKMTTVNCGVVRFAVREGDAVADQTLVLETEKVLLKGGGLIDLKTEDLDLGANLAARKGIRISSGTLSSLVRIRGTLAEPKIGTDLKGAVKTGTRVGIAVATVGLSLVAESVYGEVSKDEHPCRTAMARQIEVTPDKDKTQSTSEENRVDQ